MLHEITQPRQESATVAHRWFQSAYFDLFLWLDGNRRITAFELCYDKPGSEKALRWKASRGFSHYQVDSGEEAGRKPVKATPVLLPDGAFESGRIITRFRDEAWDLPEGITGFIAEKLEVYGKGGG